MHFLKICNCSDIYLPVFAAKEEENTPAATGKTARRLARYLSPEHTGESAIRWDADSPVFFVQHLKTENYHFFLYFPAYMIR